MEHVTIVLSHYWKNVAIGKMFPLKTLISQTLLFDIIKMLPDEYFYPCPVFSLHIIFLFLYTTPASPTLLYRRSLLPSVFRIIFPLMRNLPL